MNVEAWCGFCGESFRLVEVVDAEAAGACPRCGRVFDPAYRAVVVAEVRQLLTAASALRDAGRQLRDLAPHLHVDARRLCTDIGAELDG